MKKGIKIFGGIAMSLLIIFAAFILAVNLPSPFGYRPYIVLSGSMEPEIPTGSMVYTDTNATDPQIGDVVTYDTVMASGEEIHITHRVMDIAEDGMVLMKGDANEDTDGYIEPDRISGTVRFHIPYLGYVMSVLSGKIIIVIAVWVILLNIVAAVLTAVSGTEKKKGNN